MSKKIDVLISGQGIAGSLLSWFFIKNGFSVLVVDRCEKFTSSRIAGGMIHPITGRRLVKSWKADLFIPFAESTFKEIESALKNSYYHNMPVLEIFHDNGHRNNWMAKSEDSQCAPFIGKLCSPSSVPASIIAPLGGQYVINSGWLNTSGFLTDFKKFLIDKNSFEEGDLDSSTIELTEEGIRWNQIEARYFVSCSGFNSKKDPMWKWLPFNPAKGEIIEIENETLPDNQVIHNQIKIIPIASGKFKCGATYTWNSFDEIASEEGLKKLKDGLKKMMDASYKIISHRAAVRPSTVDRRPLLGLHPQHPQLAIFNGLGTKGVMLAPYLAQCMMAFLMQGEPLDAEFDISRFNKNLKSDPN